MENKAKLDEFKEELWETVVKFREFILIDTGLDEKTRTELFEKMVNLGKQKQNMGPIHVKVVSKGTIKIKLVI